MTPITSEHASEFCVPQTSKPSLKLTNIKIDSPTPYAFREGVRYNALGVQNIGIFDAYSEGVKIPKRKASITFENGALAHLST